MCVCACVCECVCGCRNKLCIQTFPYTLKRQYCLHKPSQVEIRGVNYTGIVEGSDQSWVSVLVNQLDQNFTKGETHTVRVFETNSVGTSNLRSTLLIVPGELYNSTPQCNMILSHSMTSLSILPTR